VNAWIKSGGLFDLPGKAVRLKELEAQTTDPSFWDQQQKAQDLLKEATRLREEISRIGSLESQLKDLQELSDLAQEDDVAILKDLDESAKSLDTTLKKVERETKFRDPADRNDALVTLNAGAGGTEAQDWAEMLLRMYERYAERKGFTVEITDIQSGEQAGIKSITFFVRGTYAYGLLKGEVGVHRLVRISPFDANKRRHTSFAACDVLPDVNEEIKIDIRDADLRVDTYRASGAGGQHINKTDSAIRITHNPTGVVVACQTQRSQTKNRERAMQMLKIKLYERERDKQRQVQEKRYDEKGDIAWGNQIRSYVFMPYQLVKDTRTGYESSQVEKVMDGELDEFIDAYLENRVQDVKRG